MFGFFNLLKDNCTTFGGLEVAENESSLSCVQKCAKPKVENIQKITNRILDSVIGNWSKDRKLRNLTPQYSDSREGLLQVFITKGIVPHNEYIT